jgi:signal transduction histidine kinase
MLRPISLQAKLFLAFLIPGSIALLGIVSSSGTVSRLMESTTQLSESTLPRTDGLWKIIEGRSQISSASNALLHHELSPQEHTALLAQIEQSWKQIEQGFREAFKPSTSQKLLEAGQTFQLDWEQWKRSHQAFLAQERVFRKIGVSDPKQEYADLIISGEMNSPKIKTVIAALEAQENLFKAKAQEKAFFQATEYPLTTLLLDSQSVAHQIQDTALQEVEMVWYSMILLILLLPMSASAIAWFLSRSIAQPIDQQILTMIQELELARDRLEEKVQERTQELQQTVQTLAEAQMQLVHAEKMSSLGQLVAGVAHEINNPISFIYGNLDHLEDYVKEIANILQLYQTHYPQPVTEIQQAVEEADLEFIQTDLLKIINSMQIGTERIHEIVLSLRNFSRLDEAEFKSVDLHEGIESTLLLLQHRLKPTLDRSEIQIIRDYGKLPPVECQAGQINQVFMNILSNAIDALETISHPQITIRTSIAEEWVQIAIADNGIGIPESIRQKIFNPFFTTKPIGKGTGMGMSISYQLVVEKHHGKLECFSTEGAEFLIQLPIRQTLSR